jgi:tetratricopeptide (TPR) repeat protein
LDDFYYEIKKLQPLNISSSDFNRNGISKNIRKSIALYDRSIEYLRIDNIDLATAYLKKSLSYNSSFCEAIKLLSLCYAYKKDFSKAEKFLKTLRKYNMYKDVADEFLKKVHVEEVTYKALDAIGNTEDCTFISKLLKSINKGVSFKKSVIVLTSIIITTGLLVLAYQLYPSIKIMSNKTVSPKVTEKNTDDKKYIQLNKNYKNLQTNYENTKSELNNLKNRDDVTLQLNDAEKSYTDGNYEKTAQILLTLKNLTLDDTSKTEFNVLWNDIKSNSVWVIYNQANNLYKQQKYADALPKLVLAKEIVPNEQIMPWLLYQIGTCYKKTNDPSNALIYFDKVKSDYPNSKYAHYSN